MHFLYADFLEHERSYELSERFWQAMLDDVAARSGQRGEWRPWQSRTFLDGTPMPKDGNPILDALSKHLRRAIRIIQHAPESDALEIAAWIDGLEFSDADGGFVEELVVSLSLSQEAAAITRGLLEKWMDGSTSRERMEDLVSGLGSG